MASIFNLALAAAGIACAIKLLNWSINNVHRWTAQGVNGFLLLFIFVGNVANFIPYVSETPAALNAVRAVCTFAAIFVASIKIWYEYSKESEKAENEAEEKAEATGADLN